ncbi:MAG TPA: tripartite tricarboxylate transporter substrate binding protein [Burkholderiales bacterium]|nr:tripartite tricarboxylate transporter substrate binding protein [Burkholderiales bacterium]
MTTAASFAAQPAQQAYPNRPVRIIVPVSPGGGVDAVARIAASHYNATWGQPFVVDNRTGAGGSIGIGLVAKAAPDGYTLLVTSSGVVTNAAIRPQGYDPIRDLTAITALNGAPYLLLTTPSLPVSNVKELVALAKSKPGGVSFGSSGVGGILHLGAELFLSLTGTQMLHVPFKGVGEAYPAVVSGDVNWILGFPTSALPLVKSGRLKAIAITGAKRSKLLPELPTVAESGVAPGYEVRAWFGLFAPAGTKRALVDRLYAEAKRAMEAAEVVRRMNAEGAEVIVNPPDEFARDVRNEYAKWRDLVKKLKL